jgi:hypothetical protein
LKTDVIDAGKESRVEVFSVSQSEKSLDNKEEKKKRQSIKNHVREIGKLRKKCHKVGNSLQVQAQFIL